MYHALPSARAALALVVAGVALSACARSPRAASQAADDHAGHDMAASASPSRAAGTTAAGAQTLPAGAADAEQRLASSPRHGEWAMIRSGTDSVRAWVVYPERSTKAPVVLVVHEIFGLSTWVRAVADQLAADGYIAIAPDLLTMKGLPTGPDSVVARAATAAIRTLVPADVHRQLASVAEYGMKLPAALPKYGIVGFCWGGGRSFLHATHSPSLGASVVYYGSPPTPEQMAAIKAPVLGLYGANDARVNATVPAADSAMRALGKTFQYEMYAGAGHGFLRQQDGQNGANLAAAQQAWPRTIGWFRQHLGR